MSFELSIVIILHHMLLAISIGNVKIAVGSDGGFGRYELFLFLVQSCLSRVVDGHQHLAIGRGFENLMAGGVGNEKEIITTRSEEHTSELKSLMRISYDVCC